MKCESFILKVIYAIGVIRIAGRSTAGKTGITNPCKSMQGKLIN